jgi:hypothetical protein
MLTVYIAHPLNAPTREGIEKNRENAAHWVAWLAAEFPIAPVATWITLSGLWLETAENRARGLEIDVELVKRCDETWLVGGRVSAGMRIESEHAKVLRDLTVLGYDTPVGTSPLTRELVAEIVGLR